jgi:hypothetical protein
MQKHLNSGSLPGWSRRVRFVRPRAQASPLGPLLCIIAEVLACSLELVLQQSHPSTHIRHTEASACVFAHSTPSTGLK